MTQRPPFEGPAIVELLGHRTVIGTCREVTLCGMTVLEIDVALPDNRSVAHLVPPNSLFAITPTTLAAIDDRWRRQNEDALASDSLLGPGDQARRAVRIAERRAVAQETRRLEMRGVHIVGEDDSI